MNAPLTLRVRLTLDGAIRDQVQNLDDADYERFRMAWLFAEHLLARSALVLEGEPKYLVSCSGMLLSVVFQRSRELFMVVGFTDFGDGPAPQGGHRQPIGSVEQILKVVGIRVDALQRASVSAPMMPSDDEGLWSDATPFEVPVPAPVPNPIESDEVRDLAAVLSTALAAVLTTIPFRMSGPRLFVLSTPVHRCVGIDDVKPAGAATPGGSTDP